ncbi:unnamed protein product [Ilex paraguariensis]|uniref:Uncharacterized protein n=1 Tax=Ilex paraguariensis TaxID=185542 RepID=A0ABC8UTG6_9AQUA
MAQGNQVGSIILNPNKQKQKQKKNVFFTLVCILQTLASVSGATKRRASGGGSNIEQQLEDRHEGPIPSCGKMTSMAMGRKIDLEQRVIPVHSFGHEYQGQLKNI